MWTEDPGWFIHQLEVWNFFILGFVTSNFLYLSFPLCILVLYGELILTPLLN